MPGLPGLLIVGERYLALPTATQIQQFWNEKSKNTRAQRQEQYVRQEEADKMLQPIKASYEASRDSLSTLQEEDVSTKNSPAWCSCVNSLVEGRGGKAATDS